MPYLRGTRTGRTQVHIGKTAGSSVSKHLHVASRNSNYSFFSVWNENSSLHLCASCILHLPSVSPRSHERFCVARADQRRTFGTPARLTACVRFRGSNYATDPQWLGLKEALKEPQPHVAALIHHGVPGVGNFLWDHELLPIKQARSRLKTPN